MARTIWPSFPNVSIIRGDLAHPIVSGNKLFKALPLVEQAKRCGSKTIISTGGRYSNHLHALSWLAREEDLRSVGLVRGYAGQTPTPTLIDCQRFGMSLHFIDHSTYNSRYSNEFWKPWLTRYQDSFRIDEGGWSDLAIEGTAKWWSYVPPTADMILVAIGSGTTYAGLVRSAPDSTKVVGVPAFLDSTGYHPLIEKLNLVGLSQHQIELWCDFIERGFGKLSPSQLQFKHDFEQETGILLDPVYNTKVLYSLRQKLLATPELKNRQIVVIHTGGTQGNRQ